MNPDAILDDVLDSTSNDKNESDTADTTKVQTTRKKPGPKPKVDTSAASAQSNIEDKENTSDNAENAEDNSSDETSAVSSELDGNSSDDATEDTAADLEQALMDNLIDAKGTEVVTGPISFEFKTLAIMYRSPSDRLPLGRVAFAWFTGEIINGYARCFTNIAGQGRIYGYVKANDAILKLISSIK